MKSNYRFSWLQWGVLFSLLLVLVSGVVYPVQAAEFDNDGFVGSDEVINDDLFLNSSTVQMNGTVNGILVANGETITINGTVHGDVFAFGAVVDIAKDAVIDGNLFAGAASVTVSGKVTGSIASGSSSIYLENDASVGKNMYYGGYSLQTDQEASIERDLFAGVYQAILNGSIGRDANIGAGAIELNGTIGRNASLDVASSSEQVTFFSPAQFMPPQYQVGMSEMIQPGLRVAESAQIAGELIYTSPENQQSQIETQPQGGVVFQTPVPDEKSTVTTTVSETEKPSSPWASKVGRTALRWIKNGARNLISLLILGGIAIWLIPSLLVKTSKKAGEETLPAAGYGFLAWLIGYVGVFIAGLVILSVGLFLSLVTIGGLSKAFFGISFSGLGLAFSVFLLMVSYGSKLVVAYLAGDWMLNKLSSKPIESKIWPMVLGVFVYVLLRSIPFIGWLFGAVVTVIGLGAMWLVYQNWRNSSKEGGEPEVVTTLPEPGEEPVE